MVSLSQCLGRVLAVDQVSASDLPRWDNSAMDGYALEAQACAEGAVTEVHGFLPAGASRVQSLVAGTAAKILTGAQLPAGADCVVPFEQVEVEGSAIRLLARPVAGDHVRRRGSDLRAGERALSAGTVLNPGEIAILASLGQASVPVVRRPRVAILSTGDELLLPGEQLEPGQIFDSNGPALTAAVQDAGGTPVVIPIARDNLADLRRHLTEGLQADILVTSAGVSTGERDLVRAALSELGAKEAFWKVAIQPGRPVAFAATERCCVFSLPGNPVAALLTFELLVRPAVRRMAGHLRPIEVTRRATLGEAVQPRPDRMTLRRVRLEYIGEQLVATSAGDQATGYLRTLARADGIALIPCGIEALPMGAEVEVHPLRQDTDFRGGIR
jgi:molybdopterin molybdotransferase